MGSVATKLLSALAAGVLLSVLTPTAALARPTQPSAAPSQIGYDISWPQCGAPLPQGQAFAIIGVNGGVANTTNPCLASQLAWAEQSTGGVGQPRVGLYVNTANPGFQGSWWPRSDTDAPDWVTPGGPDRTIAQLPPASANPYGACDYAEDSACAYRYGYVMAYDDANNRGIPVTSAASYRWWLDVETMNTWSADRTANAAVLEGMTAYFQSVGASVGLYSTGYQWNRIASVSADSNLEGLPSWLAGAPSLKSAKSLCSAAPLTVGGRVSLTQFIYRSLDNNYSCP